MGQNMNIESAIVGAMIGQILGKTSGSVLGQDSGLGGLLGSVLPIGGALAGGFGKSNKREVSPLEQMVQYSLIHPGQKIPIPQGVLGGQSLMPMHTGQSNTMQLASLLGGLAGGGKSNQASPLAGILGQLGQSVGSSAASSVGSSAAQAASDAIQALLAQQDATDWIPEDSFDTFEGSVY